jgi:UDP-N-acetylglucosamine 1-carboxyvinyltransferase
MKQFGIETEHESGAIVGKKASNIESVKIDIMVYSESKEKSTAPMISGATKTALLCSTFVKHTKIFHPYLKTDVQDLVRFMRQCGYKISISKESIEVSAPTTKPHNQYVEFYLTECVSEIMTYLALAVHTNISLTLKIANIELIKKGLELEFNLLKQMGVALLIEEANAIIIGKKHTIQSINIDVTNDSIQSDHHPFFTLMLLKGNKQARIREFVWKDRFAYAHELKKLGADLTQEANALYIRPSALLKGNQTLNASDTRAAAILILASLTAEEPVEIENIQHLHRGYENLLGSIQLLGADVIREVAVV